MHNLSKKILIPCALAMGLFSYSCFAQSTAHTVHHQSRVVHQKPLTKININSADEHHLALVKGFGDKRAKAIIAYRKRNGDFKVAGDLVKVKGIGSKLMARIKAKGETQFVLSSR